VDNTELSKNNLDKIAGIIFAYLDDIVNSSKNASLSINSLPESFNDVTEGLKYINEIVTETKLFAKELSTGNLNCKLPSSDNEIAAPLKSLYASLKHLTWQAKRVAEGDYYQRVSFMGDFSLAFNDMIEQLEQRQQSDIREKERLESMQHELEAANRAKSVFFAKMSHEMRTPMNAIIGMTELALREDIPLAAQEYINTIRQAGTNLLAIINDILDFSKIETGKLEIVPVKYMFSFLMSDVISIIKTKVLESHLNFLVNIDNNIPNKLYGDAVRIRQIFMNLLSNAVKYTQKGYISLSATGKMVDEDNIILHIEVEDTGKGIKEEDIKKLFNEFSRFDVANNVNVEGTGLGLAITQNLLMAMGGEISVQSEYGKGSIFSVTLPQKVRNKQKLVTVENPENKNVLIYEQREICINSIIQTMKSLGVKYKLVSKESEFYEYIVKTEYTHVLISSVLYKYVKKNFMKLKTDAKFFLIAEFGEIVVEKNINILTTPIYSIPIANFLNDIYDQHTFNTSHKVSINFIAPTAKALVVDDININLKVAEGLLQPYKMKIDYCKSGADAIEKIKYNRYDIVLMDHMMPEMDGIEAVAKIRELDTIDPYFRNLPIIAVTANAVSGMREIFLENGFVDFLPKPIETEKLNAILEKWIPIEKHEKPPEKRQSGAAGHINDSDENVVIKIKGLNVKDGIMMVGGSVKDYYMTLSVFYNDSLEKIKEIETYLETENLPSYTICVHSLKSSLLIIGNKELSGNAKMLEEAGKKGDMDYINANNSIFINSLKALLDNINKAMAEKNAKKPPVAVDIKLIMDKLNKLKTALETINFSDTKNAAIELRNLTQNMKNDASDAIEDILKKVKSGDYIIAIELIDSAINNAVFAENIDMVKTP